MSMTTVMACRQLGCIVLQLAFCHVQASLLHMRHPGLFYLTGLSLCAIDMAAGPPGAAPFTRAALGAALAVLPLPFYTGRLWHRVLAVSLAGGLLIAGEMITGGVWMLATDAPVGGVGTIQMYPVAYFGSMATDTAFLLVAGVHIAEPFRRFAARSDSPLDAALAGFVTLQVVLLAILTAMLFNAVPDALGFALAAVAATALVTYADIALFRSINRMRAAARERERVRVIQSELDGYLEKCAALSRHAVQMAHVRHDARNHLQVVAGLIDRGDMRAAQDYLTGFLSSPSYAGDRAC